jgi:hypothetical protein
MNPVEDFAGIKIKQNGCKQGGDVMPRTTITHFVPLTFIEFIHHNGQSIPILTEKTAGGNLVAQDSHR